MQKVMSDPHISIALAAYLLVSSYVFGTFGHPFHTVDIEQILDSSSTCGTIKEWAHLHSAHVGTLSSV